jgi:hypothetical protein
MFDGTKTLTVNGTVAKLEWANPHVYVCERITLRDPDILQFDITTTAPDIFTATDKRTRM